MFTSGYTDTPKVLTLTGDVDASTSTDSFTSVLTT